jgi:hypothetical protein
MLTRRVPDWLVPCVGSDLSTPQFCQGQEHILHSEPCSVKKSIPASHDPKIRIGQTKNDLPHRTEVCCRKNPRCEFLSFTFLPNLVTPVLPTCACDTQIIPCGGVALNEQTSQHRTDQLYSTSSVCDRCFCAKV